ncbi:hypothetical protein M0804_010383 [Polistes exclamans]|nr:hypothetical protein M0804_010383 [Polistes exclamans]
MVINVIGGFVFWLISSVSRFRHCDGFQSDLAVFSNTSHVAIENGKRSVLYSAALRIGKGGCLCILGAKAIAGVPAQGFGFRARTRQENNYAPSAPLPVGCHEVNQN